MLCGGLAGMACTSSTVLPPAASVSPPGVPSPQLGNLGRRPQSPGIVTSVPTMGGNPWKPTAPARDWQYVVVHHTATTNGSVESIHETHLKNKDKNGNAWLGIGYHFVIGNGQGMPDGAIEPTFRWKTQIQGAHAGSSNKDYNERGIGVCLVGNFENSPPTAAQRRSVKLLVQTLKNEYRIPVDRVVGHKEIRASSTECPGKLFPMAEIAVDQPEILFGLNADGVPVEFAASNSGGILR
jgi:hypothetical protein